MTVLCCITIRQPGFSPPTSASPPACALPIHLRMCQVGALIVSPTRELARQIWTVAEPFVQSVPGTTCQLLVGGTYVWGCHSAEQQLGAASRTHVTSTGSSIQGQRHSITLQT